MSKGGSYRFGRGFERTGQGKKGKMQIYFPSPLTLKEIGARVLSEVKRKGCENG